MYVCGYGWHVYGGCLLKIFPKIVFHGISGRVTRRFMWAFIKRTSVPAANHLVNMAKFCRRVFAFSFKMGQYMWGKFAYSLGSFPQPGLSGPPRANLTCLFILTLANFSSCCCLYTKIIYILSTYLHFFRFRACGLDGCLCVSVVA